MSERTEFLPFALPDIGREEFDEVRTVLESGWLTSGAKVEAFEREFARHAGARYAVAVNSCTAAMHLALEAIGLERGDFVLTTPYTFAATAEVIRYFDAIPVFVDVTPDTLNIDPNALAITIEELSRCLATGAEPTLPGVARVLGHHEGRPVRRGRIKAVIPVHMAGHPCDMQAIGAIAKAYDLAVIEDAAHACSARYQGRPIGTTLVDGTLSATCFSFYATKTLTTAEGGMVTTDSEAIASRIRVMSLHGISKDAWKRYTAEGSWYYEITAPGYKYNMPDVLAAIGLAQLRKVDAMRERREAIARQYTAAFEHRSEFETPSMHDDVVHAWHLYTLRLRDAASPLSRDQFIEDLKSRKIGASVHFIPLHTHPYYRATYGYQPTDFPIAVQEYRREISLPIYSRMSDADVQSVVDATVTALKQPRSKSDYARA